MIGVTASTLLYRVLSPAITMGLGTINDSTNHCLAVRLHDVDIKGVFVGDIDGMNVGDSI